MGAAMLALSGYGYYVVTSQRGRGVKPPTQEHLVNWSGTHEVEVSHGAASRRVLAQRRCPPRQAEVGLPCAAPPTGAVRAMRCVHVLGALLCIRLPPQVERFYQPETLEELEAVVAMAHKAGERKQERLLGGLQGWIGRLKYVRAGGTVGRHGA